MPYRSILLRCGAVLLVVACAGIGLLLTRFPEPLSQVLAIGFAVVAVILIWCGFRLLRRRGML